MTGKFFQAEQVLPGLTRIAGLGGEQCYLVEGKERALLVDGLCGVGSLRAFVRELTDLPLVMAATHGHIDHIGAAWEYGEVFIHPGDIPLMYTPAHTSAEGRLRFASAPSFRPKFSDVQPVLADVIPAGPVKTYPILEGDVFELGGVEIEVVEVPGHTCGSVVFLDRAARYILSGDALNLNTLVGLPGSTTIEEYAASLRHFKAYQPLFDVMYGGHGPQAVPSTAIDDGIALCEKILAREDDAIPAEAPGGSTGLLASARDEQYRPLCGGCVNILYREDMLRRRPRPAIQGAPNLYR